MMKTDEIEKMEAIRRKIDSCLRTLKPTRDKNGLYSAEIRVTDYFELAAIIRKPHEVMHGGSGSGFG